MREMEFAPYEFYHLCGRGNEKKNLFLDTRDWTRFLFLALYFQSPLSFYNLSRQVTAFTERGMFSISEEDIAEICKRRTIELTTFALMPNHFHLIVYQKKEKGISAYMQRLLMGYAKYFNEKYKKTGHVFQGPFRAVHINSNDQLLYTSAYIHRNPREISVWRNKEDAYPWSSYRDYVGENRWGKLLAKDRILEQFEDGNDYKKYVVEGGAKELDAQEDPLEP